MSRKSLRFPIKYAFGETPSPWAATGLLNQRSVKLGEFLKGDRPDRAIIGGILATLIDEMFKRSPQQAIALRKLVHRGLWKDQRPTRMARTIEQLATAIYSMTSIKPNLVTRVLERCEKVKQELMLYTDAEGLIKSPFAASFSYSQYDEYKGELESWSEIVCPDCGASEYLRDSEELPVLLQESMLDDFDHLSGPYCRCKGCENVVRPFMRPADSLPDGATYGEEAHDDYVDNLKELLEQLEAHLRKAGLPTPAKLSITYNTSDWRGRTGYKVVDFDGASLADALRVNGDFSIDDGWLMLLPDGDGYLTCTLSHHDASGSVRIFPVWSCDLATDDEVYLPFEDLPRARYNAEVANTLLRGREDVFSFTQKGKAFDLVDTTNLRSELENLTGALGSRYVEDAECLGGFGLALNLLLEGLTADLATAQVDLHRVTKIRVVIDDYLKQGE